MKQVWITKTGAPETLQLREAPDPEPGRGEIRVRVHASGVNFADIMARMGLYPDAPRLPAVVGYEACGVVDRTGPNASNFREGDRVVALCRFGGYSDTVVVNERQAYAIPDTMSFSQGAAIPVNYLTAYQMLVAMGRARPGDRVLIHSAAGGVGLAAIDLCHLVGAEPIGVAGAAKHALLRERGVKLLVDSRAPAFDDAVLSLTQGKGVTLALDPAGGDSWRRSLRCLEPTGLLVVFGFSAATSGRLPKWLSGLRSLAAVPWMKMSPLGLMSANKGVLGVNLGHLWSHAAQVRTWGEQILDWAGEGKIHPRVDREFPLADAASAHRYIEERRNVGKVVLVSP